MIHGSSLDIVLNQLQFCHHVFDLLPRLGHAVRAAIQFSGSFHNILDQLFLFLFFLYSCFQLLFLFLLLFLRCFGFFLCSALFF